MQNFYAVKCIRYICTKGPPLAARGAFEGASEFLSCYKIRGKSPEKPKGVFLVGSRRSGGKLKSLRASNCKPAQRLQFEEEEPDSEDKSLRD